MQTLKKSESYLGDLHSLSICPAWNDGSAAGIVHGIGKGVNSVSNVYKYLGPDCAPGPYSFAVSCTQSIPAILLTANCTHQVLSSDPEYPLLRCLQSVPSYRSVSAAYPRQLTTTSDFSRRGNHFIFAPLSFSPRKPKKSSSDAYAHVHSLENQRNRH